ncbi:MAG TPA: cytochrome c maturation protein CcmE [Chloroflexota bacterium]|nr:cytochrome c maturation protein CcmE [Chloroflexota bacterium]
MRRSTRPLILGGTIILAAIGFLVYQGISNALVYYITPSELVSRGPAADGQSFRVGGLVEPGSVRWNPRTQTVHFVLSDLKHSVAVVSHGQPPEMFRGGSGCVVEGVLRAGVFQATNLMVKHDGTYKAPAPGKSPAADNYATKP